MPGVKSKAEEKDEEEEEEQEKDKEDEEEQEKVWNGERGGRRGRNIGNTFRENSRRPTTCSADLAARVLVAILLLTIMLVARGVLLAKCANHCLERSAVCKETPGERTRKW